MEWDPAKYTEFADHRNRPFFDLTERIRADRPRTVVDMGCGPGNLTAALAERWPSASVVGLDASPRMVDAARSAHRDSNLAFRRVEATGWKPGSDVDVLVSNAMLQWVPDHMDVLAGWLDALEPGAWFAAQVPGEDPVLEWVRGAALRPVLEALDDDAASDFQREYGRLVRAAYPAFPGPGGTPLTLFPFRRIFLVGHKS